MKGERGMAVMQKSTGRASSMAGGLAAGALCSMGITLLGTSLMAWLIGNEMMAESNIGYGVMIMLILASFLGSKVACGKIKRQRLVCCVSSGAIYFGVLLSITAMFFGGQYHGIGATVLLIIAGCGLAALTGLRKKRAGKRTLRRFANR